MKPIPVVGQTLYSLNVGNASRATKQVLRPVIVRKVGRVYFTTSPEGAPHFTTQYHLDTWREKTEYSSHSELYASPEEWEAKTEAETLRKKLCHAFDWSREIQNQLPLDTLRQIAALLPKE